MTPKIKLTLVSTVLAPKFTDGNISMSRVAITPELLAEVSRNLSGHPLTNQVLRELCPTLPEPEKGGKWDGVGVALAVRPKEGVRGAATQGDTPVTLDDLEAVTFSWHVRD